MTESSAEDKLENKRKRVMTELSAEDKLGNETSEQTDDDTRHIIIP